MLTSLLREKSTQWKEVGSLTESEKVRIEYTIKEAADASLWATVPRLNITGWTWCVGGGQMLEDHKKAIEQTRKHVQTYCDAVAYGMIKVDMGNGVWTLCRQIHELGFELFEMNQTARA